MKAKKANPWKEKNCPHRRLAILRLNLSSKNKNLKRVNDSVSSPSKAMISYSQELKYV